MNPADIHLIAVSLDRLADTAHTFAQAWVIIACIGLFVGRK